MSRPALNGKAMSAAERQARRRARLRSTTPQVSPSLDADHTTKASAPPRHGTMSQPVWLALDAESIAALIIANVPETKADAIAKSLAQRLAIWRCGSFDLRLVPRR